MQAFREMQGRGLYSPCRNEFRPVAGQRMSGIDLISVTSRFLGRDSFDRQALLTWARAKAGGPSVRMICGEMGWTRSTFEEARRRGSRAVADSILAEIRAVE